MNQQDQTKAQILIEFNRNDVTVTHWTSEGLSYTKEHHWNESQTPWVTPDKSAQWLRSLFEQEKIEHCKIAISLPRSIIGLHLLEIPKVADEHLCEVVSLQLETIYNEKISGITSDIRKLELAANNRQFVLAGTMPTSLSERMNTIFEERKLTITHMSCIDLMGAETVLDREELQPALRNVVTIFGQRVSLGIFVGSQLIQSQSIARQESFPDAKMLLGRLRLLEAALPDSIKALPRLEGICQIDSGLASDLPTDFSARIQMPIRLVDLKKAFLDGQPVSSKNVLDFTHRWSPKRKKPVWKKMAVPAVMVAAFISVLIGFHRVSNQRLQNELQSMESALAQVKSELSKLEPLGERWHELQKWQNGKHSWGDELIQIAKQSARFESSYLSRVQFESSDNNEPSAIRIEGRSRSVGDAISWNRFEDEPASGYSLVPQAIENSVADPSFPIQFRTEALLPKFDSQENMQ